MVANAFSIGGLIGGGALGIAGGILGERNSRKARRRQRKALNFARTIASQERDRILNDPLIQRSRSFLEDTFGDAANSPLANDLVAGIRAGQSVRGTFHGNAGAVAEAAARSGFSQQLRASLLPQNIRFATLGNDIFSSVLAREAPLQVAASTGAQLFGAPNLISQGAAAIGQGISGAAGGFNIGSALAPQPSTPLQQAPQTQALPLQGAQDPDALLRLQGIDPSLFQQLLGGTGSFPSPAANRVGGF